MAAKLTAISVEKWKPDPAKRQEVADAGQPGLYLIVQPSGVKSWAVRYRRKSDDAPRKLTLAKCTLEKARKLAREALNEVGDGKDPAATKQINRQEISDAVLVDDAFRSFLDKHVKGKGGRPIRESSRVETARLLGFKRDPKDPGAWIASGNGALARWHGRALVSIMQSDVHDLLDSIIADGHPVVGQPHAGGAQDVLSLALGARNAGRLAGRQHRRSVRGGAARARAERCRTGSPVAGGRCLAVRQHGQAADLERGAPRRSARGDVERVRRA